MKTLTFRLYYLCLVLSLFSNLSVAAQSSQNRGYKVELLSTQQLEEYAGIAAKAEHQWLVLDLRFTNEMDPFLVFDYEVDETINILKLQDRMFLVSGTGRIYRLNPSVFGTDGHFLSNLQLANSGTRVSGRLAFEILEEGNDALELHIYDENFAPLVIPLQGTLPDSLLPSGSVVQENSAVALAVGEHGPVSLPGVQPRPGMQHYAVDLWGQSRWTRSVPAYYLTEGAAADAMAPNDFFFEYLLSTNLITLIAEGGYAYPLIPEWSLGVDTHPAFISRRWTRSRLVFEIPENVGHLELHCLFGKMGISKDAKPRKGLRFSLKESSPLLSAPDGVLQIRDPKGTNELTVDLALLQDASPWGVDTAVWLPLWVQFENTGAEAGMLSPAGRFWFDVEGTEFNGASQPENNAYAPPENLFLDIGFPRSMLLLFPRDSLKSASKLTLAYSGIGIYREFAVDLETLTLEVLEESVGDAPETAAQVQPLNTDSTSAEPSLPSATQSDASTVPESAPVSSPVSNETELSPPPPPEVRVTPRVVELPPAPYHDPATQQAAEVLAQLRTEAFPIPEKAEYATFEADFGAVASEESEPNDKWETASALQLNQTVSGVIESEGHDYWQLTIPDSMAEPSVRLDLLAAFAAPDDSFTGAYVAIHDSDRKQILSLWVEDPYQSALRNLRLEPGTYTVSVRNYSSQPAAPYLLHMREVRKAQLWEMEPNARNERELRVRSGTVVHGMLGNRDEADTVIWELLPEQEGSRYDILVVTDQPELQVSVSVYDADRNRLYAKDGAGELVLGDFSPNAGDLFLVLESRHSEPIHYRLLIQERDRLPERWEREPNDVLESGNLVVVETFDDQQPELLGRLEGRYGDAFAIRVTDRNSVYHVTLAGAGDLKFSYVDKRRGTLASAWGSDGEAASLVDLRLPLGLNYFMIERVDGDYAVNVQQVPIPSEHYEWEPNDSESQAQWMLPGVRYSGRLLSNHDRDHFRVVVQQAMHYQFSLHAPEDGKLSLQVSGNGIPVQSVVQKDGEVTLEQRIFLLPGSYAVRLDARVPSTGFYELMVEADPVPEGLEKARIDGLRLQNETPELLAAAFSDHFQEVRQRVSVSNEGPEPLELHVHAASSNYRITSDASHPEPLNLSPGESRLIEVPWVLEPDLPGSERTEVQLGFSAAGRYMSTSSVIQPSTETLATGILPERQMLLDRLAGGMNLNALDLGARPVLEPESLYLGTTLPSESYLKYLTDGVLANRSFWGEVAVIEMAGNGQVELVGTSIDLHGRGDLWQSAKDFSIETSMDGTTFTEVFRGTLAPQTGEQAFLFDQPVKARYSRLRLHSTHSGKSGETPHVGEWRMIADPKATLPEWESINLLDPSVGGHRIRSAEREWVFGFQHNRAARIDALVWENKQASSGTYGNPQSVTLEVSEASPVGPWTTVGTFDLSEADQADSLRLRIPLDGSPWVRFAKISWEKADGARYTNEPHQLELIEKPVSEEYRSILGEWQGPTDFAWREYREKQQGQSTAVNLERIKSSRESPYALSPDIWVDSVAWINRGWEDWYEIDPVKVKKQLQFTVESRPFLKIAVEVQDAQGNAVEVAERTIGAHRKEFTFLADPGIRYRVHVFEPKRSIVYLWDVSGSMGRFVHSIENAVLKFADEIDPETEQVQLLPFDDPARFLTDGWVSDRYELQMLIRNYDPPSSSYAHLNLLEATKAMKDQIGTKAAIVITDCESSRNVNNELWRALEEVKPAVFTFQTSDQTSGYRIEQDDMQDWASVAGGFYHNTRATHELDSAFEKVQAYLRRPAPYRIQLTAPELKPSTIRIEDARDPDSIRDPQKDGVLLIIDASASMRENLPDGQMKVNAAKTVIENLTQHYLPDGIHFGLRVFGHRGGTDCESELMIPVTPLDRAATKQKLMFVRSSSLGNTSLGEALGKAAEDLGELPGLKRVVVLTDGEETCHGDPAGEIAKLAEAGLDVTVNIVGFTLGDEAVKQNYGNWVKATGGKYYDAQDATALGKALQEAMTPVELPEFEIYDVHGAKVAVGKVGDAPIEVESGVYTVKILDPDAPRTETVEAFETNIRLDYR